MKNKNLHAFSIIEVLIGIFIFTLGLISVYGVISSTLKLNDYNKNYIIASGLAREQIEQFRNIRDSNYKLLKPYNLKNPNETTNFNDVFLTGSYYKIYNDYSNLTNFPVGVSNINSFGEGEGELNGKMLDYQLCEKGNLYVYCNGTVGLKKTYFYKYIFLDEVEDINGIIDSAFKVKSKVIWYKRGYHEFEVDMIVADWRRL